MASSLPLFFSLSVQDVQLLQEMFQVKAPKRAPKAEAKAAKPRPVLIKQDRKQKYGIGMRFIKLPMEQLKEAGWGAACA